MTSLLRQVLTPRALQIALMMVLVGAAMLIADSEGGRQIAEDAQTVRAAEAVLSAAAVTEVAGREAVLIGRAHQEGIVEDDEVDRATADLDRRLQELDSGMDTLTSLTVVSEGLLGAYLQMRVEAEEIIEAVRAGAIDRAGQAGLDLASASTELSEHASAIRNERQAHMDAIQEGVARVATASRFVAGLGIPALALLFLYRAMKARQKQVLLKAEIERERQLRRKKDQFLAGASHHLNTPFAAVLGFAELLNDNARSFNAAMRNEIIELLAEQAREASHVAEDLLIAARSDMAELTLEPADVDLRSVFETVTRSWEGTQLGRLHISGNGLARGDPKRVTQAIRNLLRNAAGKAGTITVEITEAFNWAVVEVSDDGPGVPPGQEERIFQPYYTTSQIDGLPPSLGLGLSVARSLARAMGGELAYRREDDLNVLSLKLPRAVSVEAAAATDDLIIDATEGVPTAEDLSKLLERGGPEVVYQPIVDMTARVRGKQAVVGYEGLARFPFSPPPMWFKAADAAGLGLELQLACLRCAIHAFEPDREDQFLALNLSDETLTSSLLLDSLEGIDPSRLILELSETAVIRNYHHTKGSVDLLRDHGIRIGIDDVGAEEIDLWHIIRLGASVVKIDMSLVREVEHSPSIRGLIKAIVALGEEVGLLVIAEGIETETEHRCLTELGVKLGQGYLYGKPGPLKWSARVLSA